MARRVLLICGILFTLFYIGSDIFAAMSNAGYSYLDRSVSELSAIGAPTRSFLVPILIACQLLFIAFSVGVLATAGKKRNLKITGILLATHGVVGLVWLFFPMNIREAGQSFTGIIHLIFAGVVVLLMLMYISFGSGARGKGFRIYSIVTILAMLVSGALAAMRAPQVDAGLLTPWLGVIERVSVYSPMIWVGVLAAVLLQTKNIRYQNNLEA